MSLFPARFAQRCCNYFKRCICNFSFHGLVLTLFAGTTWWYTYCILHSAYQLYMLQNIGSRVMVKFTKCAQCGLCTSVHKYMAFI